MLVSILDMFSVTCRGAPEHKPASHPKVFDFQLSDGAPSMDTRHGADRLKFACRLNAKLLWIFGDAKWMTRMELVERYREHELVCERRISRYSTECPQSWSEVGAFVAQAIALRLLAGEGVEDGKRWGLLDRLPHYIIYKGKPIQIMGVNPDLNAVSSAGIPSKQVALSNHSARVGADTEISSTLEGTVIDAPRITVPHGWISSGYVPECIAGKELSSVIGVVREAHHDAGMDKKTLKIWLLALTSAREFAKQNAKIQREFQPEHCELPPEDLMAMQSLL
jgi:hypothetical protein